MRHVDLDPVGAVIELLARRLSCFDRTINDLSSLWDFQLGGTAFEHIAAGRGNRAGCHEQAGAWNVAAIDGLLDAHVAVAGTLGLDITQSRESLFQSPPCRDRSACRTQCVG